MDYQLLNKNQRVNHFKMEGVHLLSMVVDVKLKGSNWYSFRFNGETYNYYPKSDKLHRNRGNKWTSGGYNWINNNILIKNSITNINHEHKNMF